MRRSTPLVLLLAVCGQLTAGDALPGSHGAPASNSDLNSLSALPLACCTVDKDERELLDKARWTLAKKCMIDLGFSGFVTFDTSTPPSTELLRPDSPGTLSIPSTDMDLGDKPYGIDDPDQGSRTGYHSPAPKGDDLQGSLDQYLALTGDLRHGDPKQFHGHPIPEKGCLGRENRRIFGSRPAEEKINGIRISGYELTVMRLMSQATRKAQKDPAYQRADRAWSSCMKKEGLSYKHPTDAQ